MPVILLERIPLPSLKTYTSASILLLACAIYFAHQTVVSPDEESATNRTANETDNSSLVIDEDPPAHYREESYTMMLFTVLLRETWCVSTLINTAYCCLILVGKLIQKLVFGELRVSEQQHIKDKFWNFVFYKFIFIFGVMNVQQMDEVVYWCAWFSILGFLHLLAQLCKDRFEYLSFSPTTPAWTHAKVLMLLVAVQGVCFFLLSICVFVLYMYASWNTFAFMAAECVLLIIKTFYVLTRYAIHLWDLNHDGVWENRAMYVYYSELIFELTGLSVDFSHHLHMLLWGNIFLSMASLVICMQLRYLFHEVQRRVKRHKNYLRVVSSMEAKFPMATREDLEINSDDCAICWEKIESARKLPCNHLFHNACLRSWLEQDTSCPTCRVSLSDLQLPQAGDQQRAQAVDEPPRVPAPPGNQFTNHFFHFDGSRYVSWLPSFSVEVTHTQILGNGPPPHTVQTSQLDNMARQVLEVFPNMSQEVIIDDLRTTRSVEVTIENIIEGRVTIPPTTFRNNNQAAVTNNNESGSSTSSVGSDSSEGEADPEDLSLQAPALRDNSNTAPMGPSNLNFNADDSSTADVALAVIPPNEGVDIPTVAGSRFSKSPSERECMLSGRKEGLLEQARKKYLSKQTSQPDVVSASGDQVQQTLQEFLDSTDDPAFYTEQSSNSQNLASRPDELRRRRELAFRAALSRMSQRE